MQCGMPLCSLCGFDAIGVCFLLFVVLLAVFEVWSC